MRNPFKNKKVSKKDWSAALEMLKTLPRPVLERREQCFHEHMTKIVHDATLFSCDKCGQIIDVVGAKMYWPENYIKEAGRVLEHIEKENPDLKVLKK